MTRLLSLVAVLVGLALPASAQDLTREQERGITQLTQLLVGSWRSTTTVRERASEREIGIVLHATRVDVEGMANAIYVEIAREDALDEPYYQSVFQILPYGDALRLRTHEFRLSAAARNSVAGAWAVPEFWRPFTIDDFIATIDVDMAPLGDGTWVGQSPHPYPTSIAGAVEMVSTLEIGPARLATADRGISADGEVIWGNTPESKLVFEPYTPSVMVDRRNSGVLRLIYLMPEGEPADEGWSTEFSFIAWTHRDSRLVFSSDLTKRTVRFIAPTTQVFRGWLELADGVTTGTLVKAFVPAAFAYGTRGRPEASVPEGADLVIWAKALDVYPDPVAMEQIRRFNEERAARERGELPPEGGAPENQGPAPMGPAGGGN